MITATVTNPERRIWWMNVLGTDTVPIISSIPILVSVPGIGRTEAYMLDVPSLTEEQRTNLVAALTEKFKVPLDIAKKEFERGVPVLADDVTVTSTNTDLILNMIDDDDFDDDDNDADDKDLIAEFSVGADPFEDDELDGE